MLSENGSPITEATVFLQSLDGEQCAKLFQSEKGDARSVQKLNRCVHDVGSTTPDIQGKYQFAAQQPGWYAIHFLWSIGKKPSQPSGFKEGRWAVMFAGHKDSSGKYDTMAQDSAFYFSAKEDVIRDFDTSALGSVAQEPKTLRGRLSLPTKNWGVVLDLPGFTVRSVETKPDGRRYMIAQNDTTNVVVSLTLEQVKPGPSASCRELLEKKTANPPFKIRDVHFSRSGDLDVMEYMVPEFSSKPVNQKSIFACQFHDDTYVDLHVSKVNYVTADEPLFANVINSMHIASVQESSMELMEQASRLYLQHNYKDAIGPYSKALELEKVNPKLEKRFWHVLVDNLGMSYGITGDLQKARETFDYGISKDPTYPMFYYNLACTYAEMDDAVQAGSYLKKAFDYKANTLQSETMPDPRTDDSFKKLMKNKEFRELAEGLAR
jgi:hypothetical protein